MKARYGYGKKKLPSALEACQIHLMNINLPSISSSSEIVSIIMISIVIKFFQLQWHTLKKSSTPFYHQLYVDVISQFASSFYLISPIMNHSLN